MGDRYDECDLMRGAAGRCRHCDGELQGRRRTWCSPECAEVYTREHLWSFARVEAVKRDGRRCRHCGTSPDDLAAVAGLLAVFGSPMALTVRVKAMYVSARVIDGRTGRAEDFWLFTEVMEAVRSSALEVNHIDPRRGQGYHAGCWNHLDNLETLCHDCHADVMAAQRGASRRPRRGQDPTLFEAVARA